MKVLGCVGVQEWMCSYRTLYNSVTRDSVSSRMWWAMNTFVRKAGRAVPGVGLHNEMCLCQKVDPYLK